MITQRLYIKLINLNSKRPFFASIILTQCLIIEETGVKTPLNKTSKLYILYVFPSGGMRPLIDVLLQATTQKNIFGYNKNKNKITL